MSMSEWAKHEVELACKHENPDRKEGEWDYGCACYESALKAYLCLMEDGHSGMSFGFTRNILIRLMEGLPLTPLEDNDEDWNCCCEKSNGSLTYQHKRMGSLFKDVYSDGRIEYHNNEDYYCIDEESGLSYRGGGTKDILNDYRQPITFPYFPDKNKWVVHTREYLTDRKNGDFDTKEYLYIIAPSGERIDVNRYFAETDDGWKEISKEEFCDRVRLHNERVKNEQEENYNE